MTFFCLILYSYEGRSKSSKLHRERRAIAEYFSCSETQPLLIKLEKIPHTCLNFCACEAHTKMRGL